MEIIAAGVTRAEKEGISLEASAKRTAEDSRVAKKRLPGLGHRTHTTDPRTAVLFDMARENGIAAKGVALIQLLEQEVSKLVKPLPINIDGALAAVLYDLGFPPAFGKLVFIIGRVAGLTAEVAEEYAREKAMRIHIPVAYDGAPPREIE